MKSSKLFQQLFPPLLICVALTACAAEGPKATVVQPGPPGQSSKVLPADEVPRSDGREYTDADVRFMQGMIRHHSQALRMTALVAGRSASKDLPRLAKRIEVSQQDEIGLMVRWLRARLQQVPSVDSGHDHQGGDLMPGMLTEEQMAELENAKGATFDRLFYQYMIQHHMGALKMVEQLYADKGGQEPEIDQFAGHVDADQRIEIDRMQKLLTSTAG